jgi:hypothetical protein
MGKKLSKSIKVGILSVVVLFLIILAALWIPFSRYMGFPPLNVKMVRIDKIQKMDDDYVREILTASSDGYEKFLWWVYPQNVEFGNRTDNPEQIASIMAAVKSVRITDPDTFLGIPSFLGFKCKNGKIYIIDLYTNREKKRVYGVGYEDRTGDLYKELVKAGLIQ